MLLLFLITCISFILLFKSLSLKPLPPWASEMRLISLWFWKELSLFPISRSITNSLSCSLSEIPSKMSMKKKGLTSKVENVHEESSGEMSVLDLPELVLESILEKLPPDGLSSMAAVCSSLRDRCMSDHLWERHMKQKWGRIIGPAAYRAWQLHMASINDSSFFERGKQKGLKRYLSRLWSLSWIQSKLHYSSTRRSSLPVDSIMSKYLALESGRFLFPAQVYNREVLTVTTWFQLLICGFSFSNFYSLSLQNFKFVCRWSPVNLFCFFFS